MCLCVLCSASFIQSRNVGLLLVMLVIINTQARSFKLFCYVAYIFPGL